MDFKLLTFKGGIYPPHNKSATEKKPIKDAKEGKQVIIPMQQHAGAPCKPLVSKGDYVKVGQRIGEPDGFVSAPVHSSVSGTVTSVGPMLHPAGQRVMSVVIEPDGLNAIDEGIAPKGDIDTLSPNDIKSIIQESGIVGLGGGVFPTHVKLSPPEGKKIDAIILNGAECEPYLTADHRLMLERPEDVVYGLRAMLRATGVKRGYIGIENNKKDAIERIRKCIKDSPNIELKVLKTKYPQGAEKQLIYAITKRVVPSGGLPMDVGVIVNNVGTAAAIAEAIKTGMPLIQRIVTVAGDGVKEPQNLRVKLGTTFKDVIIQCGGMVGDVGKIIMGGPMMGIAQYDLNVPVIKCTSGILVLSRQSASLPEQGPCIRCGKCITVCPVNLMPLLISQYILDDNFEQAEKHHALDCIECGSCSYICPAKRPLLQSIRVAKGVIMANKKKCN